MKHKLVKCPNLWQLLHWYLFARHWKPSRWVESPHLLHLSFCLWALLELKGFLYWLGCFCSTFLFCIGLGLAWGLCILYFPLDSSVCWCLIKWICVARISPATCLMCLAVALELSYFLASWHTLVAGNLSKPTLPSFMVFETKSSSHRKNQNISLCKILAVFVGTLQDWPVLVHCCTIHQHF